jgi:hypothetical protein
MTVTTAAPDPHEGDPVAPILAMLAALPVESLAELESALARRLQPPPTAAERRVDELGFLAQLLHELRPPDQTQPGDSFETAGAKGGRGRRRAGAIDVPRLNRMVYEQRQPLEAPDAPSAQLLVKRYRTWTRACRAAYGLRPDGRSIGPSNPWMQPQRGKSGRPRYHEDDVRDSIRRCAFLLGRVPSAGDYHLWAREQKRLDRLRGGGERSEGGHPLVPGIQVVYRIYKKAGSEANRWRAAVADANLDDADVARARYKLLRLDETQAAPAPDQALLLLPISEAIAQAQEVGVSLDWLAGRAVEPGTPPSEGAVFDPACVVAERNRRGIADSALRDALRLQLGPWRRLLNGKLEPTLGQVSILGQALGVESAKLIRRR